MIELTKFDELFLELSWKWINDEEVKILIDTKPVTKQEQIIWYHSLEKRDDYKIWGIMADGEPIGAAGFKDIKEKTAYTFWYIGEKQYWGKRYGVLLAETVTKKAISLGFTEIYGEILLENFRSLNLVFKEGWKIIGIIKDKGYYTVMKKL